MLALTHPCTLSAIVLLLLNDHVLKAVAPSPLTGKLSDFAGLVFFPMLGVVVLGFVLRLERHQGPRLAAVAFAATGMAFALLKAAAPVNAAALGLADRWFGIHLQLALDPTDLWALAVLPAAFLIWRHAEARPRPVSLRAGILSTSVAALAALATSPCPPEQPIARLLTDGQEVYAVARAWEPFSAVYRSQDSGRSWAFLQEAEVPVTLAAQAEQPVVYPVVACLPASPQSCYRIDGTSPQVERSEDGGATWEVAWSPPTSRLSYMRRVASGSGQLLACGKEIDFTPHDLILLKVGGEAIVLVALGNEGVLRSPAGSESWERLGVGWAEATPERAGSLRDLWPPSTILTETLLLLAAGAIAFLVLSIRSWMLAQRRPDAAGEGYRGFWWAAGFLFALVVVAALLLGAEELLLPVGIPVAMGLAYLAFLGQRWSIVIEDSLRPEATQHCLRLALLATFGSAAIAWLGFAVWMFGVLPTYALALAIAILVVVAGWLWGWRQVWRTSQPAETGTVGGAGG
jgi:hypothetical protein